MPLLCSASASTPGHAPGPSSISRMNAQTYSGIARTRIRPSRVTQTTAFQRVRCIRVGGREAGRNGSAVDRLRAASTLATIASNPARTMAAIEKASVSAIASPARPSVCSLNHPAAMPQSHSRSCSG